jgi:replicative DNA helicase
MDMGSSLVFQKIAQKVSGFNDDKLYNMYKSNQEAEIKRVEEKISKEYQNVLFDFRSGVSIEELRENLLTLKEKEGDNLKLAVYDFINRIRGPYSDETSNLAYVAPKLADLANEAKVCIISLAQTSRAKGGPSAPLEDSRIAKGSSAIEESATILLGLWRDGYNTENDNFITIAGLKMRMGQEFRLDLHWDGLRSHIRELTGEEEFDLEQFRKAKAEKEPKKSGWDS